MEVAEGKKQPQKKLWVFGIQGLFNKMHGRRSRRDIKPDLGQVQMCISVSSFWVYFCLLWLM